MLNKKLEDAFNKQINAAFWSAYLYLSMSLNFENAGLSGIANWYKIQFQEEQAHAQIFMDYVNKRGGRVELQPIEAVPTKWESPLNAFEETLKHEKVVTSLINDLFALAEEVRDYASRDRLLWFVTEQVEEEDNANQIIEKLRLIGNDGMGLYMLDQELGSRTYTTPSPLASAE